MKKQKVMSHVKGQDKTPQKTKWRENKQYIWKRIQVMIVKMIQDFRNRSSVDPQDKRKAEQRPRITKQQANRDE